ncbi:hypothetical protein J3998_08825 [Thiomicrorhabdus sp. 6S2-11]|uniref:Flp pilus-assembly TadG-like N-terminal domain-containing protein n=1 Tax=Thiomicrorhabdus marina TaxID=2818442 RepID=A0ABS3Q5U8_9GAMM|nr:hypothetical protein [Thiomicrorhabdus marina]MBO1927677.1 hypothetical protein [Thiomicrorhabdus marina]
MSRLRNKKQQQRQKGIATLLGIGGIFAALFAFDLVMTYTKLKIVDRELDNYARSVAEVSLRSELALTKDGIESGEMDITAADIISSFSLQRVGYTPGAGQLDAQDKIINKEITFGNFASDGTFYALGEENPEYAESASLGAYKYNPRSYIQEMIDDPDNHSIADLPQFNAVAVQLWTDDDFYGFVPQGRALYGALDDDNQCFCDVRYQQCMSGDLTAAEIKAGLDPDEPPEILKDLLGVLIGGGVAEHSLSDPAVSPNADEIAAAIAVPNSEARRNYCEYGYTGTHPLDSSQSKYPYIDFTQRQAWLGIDPISVDNGLVGNLLAESNYSAEDYARVTSQLPVFIYDGADTLNNEAGLLTTVDQLLGLLDPADSSGSIYSEETNATNQTAHDDLESSELPYYRCSLLTVNVDLSLLGPLTDVLGLTNEGLAQNCDGLLSSVGGVLNSVLDIVTGDEESCGLLGLGCLLGSIFDLLDPLVGPVLDLIGIGDLETVLNNLLDPIVLVHDPVYIGRSGTCIYGTDTANLAAERCLFNSNANQYQSCEYILSGLPEAEQPTLVNRLSILLLGPVKDFPAAVETLNCEMQNFRFVQPPLGASYWQEVN